MSTAGFCYPTRLGARARTARGCCCGHQRQVVARAQGLRHVQAGPGATGRRSPRPENAPGDFYVDHTCIDCDTCRWMAPQTFARVGDMSAVVHQPQTPADRLAAMQALLTCPTFSIHCSQRQRGELHAAQATFPLPVSGCAHVFHCGFAAEDSFGAASYLIRRPQGGNILVDVPRWTPLLAQRLAALGGVHWIFLTHRDDVGDHAAWARHFGASRIIHRLEANRRQGTDQCEVLLEGEGPWDLGSEPSSIGRSNSGSGGSSGAASGGSDDDAACSSSGSIASSSSNNTVCSSSSSSSSSSSGGSGGGINSSSAASGTSAAEAAGPAQPPPSDVQLLFTPGHTAGCLSLLFRPDRALFTGDHLAWSHRLQRLTIFRAYNWHSVSQQLESVAALRAGAGAGLDFLHVLPGHGRRARFADAAERERQLAALLAAEGYRGS